MSGDAIAVTRVVSRRSPSTPLGYLHRDRVSVRRLDVLDDASALLAIHTRHGRDVPSLEVTFDGEAGSGAGVSREFFTAVANALIAKPGAGNSGRSGGHAADGSSAGMGGGGGSSSSAVGTARSRDVELPLFYDESEDGAEHVLHSRGLFPAVPPCGASAGQRQRWRQRFRLLGRVMGKGLQERRLVPIPLSPLLFDVLQDHIRARHGCPPPLAGGRDADVVTRDGTVVPNCLGVTQLQVDVLQRYYPGLALLLPAACRRACARAGVAATSDGAAATAADVDGVDIDDMCLSFVVPGAEVPLPATGYPADAVVTSDSVDVYVAAVARVVTHDGIVDAIDALVCGLDDVLVPRCLLMFTPVELATLVCGEMEVAWTRQELLSSITWSHGYTSSSPEAAMFVTVLTDMSQDDRRLFLQFVTGCPSLPPGGITAFQKPLNVIRKSDPRILRSEIDGSLPSASTCFHQIKLPPYSSVDVMRERLLMAMTCSKNFIDMT